MSSSTQPRGSETTIPHLTVSTSSEEQIGIEHWERDSDIGRRGPHPIEQQSVEEPRGRGEEELEYSVVRKYARFLRETLRALMNAAVTIFGLGVGVGLILGDSFRQQSPVRFDREVEEPMVAANSTAPSCGARRPTHRNVQEAPVSTAATLLPAQ